MKKIFAVLAALLISTQMLFAVPGGVYCDNRGKRKVLIQGNTIYCLNNDGEVRSTWQVVSEDSNGQFSILPVVNGQVYSSGIPNSRNTWWSENGKIYLNLDNQVSTLVRE